jgi:hypothetical protein
MLSGSAAARDQRLGRWFDGSPGREVAPDIGRAGASSKRASDARGIARRVAAGRFGALAEGMFLRRAGWLQLAVRTPSHSPHTSDAVPATNAGAANSAKSSAVFFAASLNR